MSSLEKSANKRMPAFTITDTTSVQEEEEAPKTLYWDEALSKMLPDEVNRLPEQLADWVLCLQAQTLLRPAKVSRHV